MYVFVLSPSSSLVNCCTIDWFIEWPREALLSVALTFFEKVDLGGDETKVRETVILPNAYPARNVYLGNAAWPVACSILVANASACITLVAIVSASWLLMHLPAMPG